MRRSDFMLGGRDFATLVASQIMETDISRVGKNTTWREIAKVMTDSEIKSVPVIDDTSGLLGLITEYDMLKPIVDGKNVDEVKASDIYSKDAVTVTGDTAAMKVLETFADKRVFKILVVDGGELKGVIVKHDVILAYLNATGKAPEGFDSSIF